MEPTLLQTQQTLATKAINLQVQYDALSQQLEEAKEELRQLANGKILNIVVEDVGRVNVTEPRAGTEKSVVSVVEDRLTRAPELRQKLVNLGVAKEVLVVDEIKLAELPELKQKLIGKGVLHEEIKKVSSAKASVRIQPNA